MPNYHVHVELAISMSGGAARGHGNTNLAGDLVGAFHVEHQYIVISCKYKCSEATVTKRAITEARRVALNTLVAYGIRGAYVNTVGATVVAVN